jgi:RNA polymerase sigma-70 factor (ECF subfamily)
MRRGDERFVDMLYDRYANAIFGIALQIVGDESLAKDVVQDSFVKVWKNAASFDPRRSKVFTWMYRIVRNTAIDRLRREKNKRTDEIQNDGSDVSLKTTREVHTDSMDIPAQLNKLEEKYRETVVLLFFKGHTQQETADILGIPLGTVKSRWRVALRELRKIYVEDDRKMKDGSR